MKKLLIKTLFILTLIAAVGLVIGQFYPRSFQGLFETKPSHSRKTIFQFRAERWQQGLRTSIDHRPSKQRYFNTQINLILSDEILSKAIIDYQLDELWKKDKAELLKTMRQHLEVSRANTHKSIAVISFAKTDEQAQQLAYAIVMTYSYTMLEADVKRSHEILSKYNERIQQQIKKVDEKRNKLYETSKKLGFGGYSTKLTGSTALSPRELYDERSRSIQFLEHFLTIIKDSDDQTLVTQIIISERPEARRLEAEVKSIREMKEAIQNILIHGVATHHPRVKALKAKMQKAEKDLFKYANDIRDKLSNDLVVSKLALAKFKEKMKKIDEESVKTIKHQTEFAKAREEYERESKILEALKQAELSVLLQCDFDPDPRKYLLFHKRGWTPETAKMMAARRVK